MEDSMFACLDCGVDTNEIDHYYMVHNRVWNKAVPEGGQLCIPCLEKRLGRAVTPYDFPLKVPVNQEFVLFYFPDLARRHRVRLKRYIVNVGIPYIVDACNKRSALRHHGHRPTRANLANVGLWENDRYLPPIEEGTRVENADSRLQVYIRRRPHQPLVSLATITEPPY